MSNKKLEKINELISNKNFEEAKVALLQILQNDEHDIEALKLLGLCNVNLGLFTEGKSNFETVVKYKSDDATSWFYLASCYDNLDDFLHAKTAYQEVINLRENYMDAYKNLGVVFIKDQEPDKALELAQKAITMVQDDYLFYYLAGTSLLAMKEFQKSIEYFEKAISINPEHAQLYNNLGTAYLSLGNYPLAYENYIKSSTIDPRDSITFYNIASILQIQHKHEEACEFFRKAYSLENAEHILISLALSEFKSAQFDEAIRHYKILVAAHPEKNNFQYNLACCYEMIGEYNFAIGILDQLVLLNPKSKAMLQKLADLYLKTEQPAKAKEVYERIITQGIVSAEIYYEYAMICAKTNDLDIAEKILKKVIELDPDAAHARRDLGVIYLNKRLFDYAKDEFEKAYAIAPQNPTMVFEYANFLHATSDFQAAQKLYDEACLLDRTDPNIIIFKALNLESMKQLEEAKTAIEEAMKICPEEPVVLFTAGRINYGLNDYEQAQMLLIKAWEIEKTPEVENLLAMTYAAQDEHEKACNIFDKLISENPLNTSLLINGAKSYQALGQDAKAQELLNKVLEIFPESEEAQELLKEISVKNIN
jgi:tetratricopeptide (TPR) repeat protein